ncbi:hypothetical protein CEP53_012475 [Fusarium sp. AF-6]|nr:hypothetical protein CEP53_012475 [Fusarium sp. AF-6]
MLQEVRQLDITIAILPDFSIGLSIKLTSFHPTLFHVYKRSLRPYPHETSTLSCWVPGSGHANNEREYRCHYFLVDEQGQFSLMR